MESAAIIHSVLSGQEGPPLHVVLANAAAALHVAGRAANLVDGVEQARHTIASGAASRLLADVVACSQSE
jgi:anthranilate phosphoribosyltransferase